MATEGVATDGVATSSVATYSVSVAIEGGDSGYQEGGYSLIVT